MSEYVDKWDYRETNTTSNCLTCPYCERTFEFQGDPLQEDEDREQECPKCERTFLLRLTITHRLHCCPEVEK